MISMKLKNYQVLSLFQALTRLDDPDSGKKDVKSEPAVKFKFKATVLYALAKNHRKTKNAVEDIEKTRSRLFKKYQSDNEDELKGDKAKEFVNEYNAFLEESTDLDVFQINVDDLELDKNSIPIQIMSELVGTVIGD